MTHRIVAVLILVAVGTCAWRAWRGRVRGSGTQGEGEALAGAPGIPRAVARLALFWFVLILAQAGLGAATVLSQKAADIATAHVLAGALSLATGALLCIICRCSPQLQRSPAVWSADGMRGASRLAARTAA
jgi:heme A synthase